MNRFNQSRVKAVKELKSMIMRDINLWRKLPELCGKINGITGYSDALTHCEDDGKWYISSVVPNQYYLFEVDCYKGKVFYTGSEDEVDDNDFQILTVSECDINISKILNEYKE